VGCRYCREKKKKQVTWAGARRWWEEAASRDGPKTGQNVNNDYMTKCYQDIVLWPNVHPFCLNFSDTSRIVITACILKTPHVDIVLTIE
jgi:hypothetical protein